MTIKTEKPLDYSGQVWRGIDDKFPKKIHNATTTSDGLMSAEDKAKLDSIDVNDHNRVYDVASWESDGLLSKDDKRKLDGVEENANNYIHPNTPEIRHVTDKQIEYWNAKASTSVATHEVNGLMSAIDKKKLDGIQENANNYIHPNTPEIRHVTDKQIEYWNNKAEKDIANWDYDGLLSKEDKKKLDGIEEGANKYIHPNNEGIRHVSDAEKEYWNSKADKTVVTNSENGLMSFKDKIKLDGIEPNANNYIHPNDENTRHVTDEQIKFWDSKGSTEIASQTKNGLMSAEDKKTLDRLALVMDTDTTDNHFVTSEEKEYWNNKVNFTDLATQSRPGLMSAEDKAKLDNVEKINSFELENISYNMTADEFSSNGKVNILINDISSEDFITMGLDYDSITSEQYDAAAIAKFITKVVEDGLEITCFGEMPTIDIPVIISIIRHP